MENSTTRILDDLHKDEVSTGILEIGRYLTFVISTLNSIGDTLDVREGVSLATSFAKKALDILRKDGQCNG